MGGENIFWLTQKILSGVKKIFSWAKNMVSLTETVVIVTQKIFSGIEKIILFAKTTVSLIETMVY